jgi:hypothetical protein
MKLRQKLASLWTTYAGRVVAWALGPLLLWATPVIVQKAQQWFGYHLTPAEVKLTIVATATGIVVKLGIWLINNGKVDAIAARVNQLAGGGVVAGSSSGPISLKIDGKELATAISAAAGTHPSESPADSGEPADVPDIE